MRSSPTIPQLIESVFVYLVALGSLAVLVWFGFSQAMAFYLGGGLG